jgi:hypothetical protein
MGAKMPWRRRFSDCNLLEQVPISEICEKNGI